MINTKAAQIFPSETFKLSIIGDREGLLWFISSIEPSQQLASSCLPRSVSNSLFPLHNRTFRVYFTTLLFSGDPSHAALTSRSEGETTSYLFRVRQAPAIKKTFFPAFPTAISSSFIEFFFMSFFLSFFFFSLLSLSLNLSSLFSLSARAVVYKTYKTWLNDGRAMQFSESLIARLSERDSTLLDRYRSPVIQKSMRECVLSLLEKDLLACSTHSVKDEPCALKALGKNGVSSFSASFSSPSSMFTPSPSSFPPQHQMPMQSHEATLHFPSKPHESM